MAKNSKFRTENLKFIIVIFVLLVAAALNYYLGKPDISLERKGLAEFPRELGNWTAISDEKIDRQSMAVLQVDDYLMRNYRNSKGEIIGLYIGYFKSQREGKGIHSPRLCLPGAGWVPVNVEVYNLKISGSSNPANAEMNKYVMGKGLNRELYLFWYHGRSRVYASEYWNKLYLIWDGLTKRRTDGALVRVNNPATRNPEKALQTQIEFINLFYPLLKEYIPD